MSPVEHSAPKFLKRFSGLCQIDLFSCNGIKGKKPGTLDPKPNCANNCIHCTFSRFLANSSDIIEDLNDGEVYRF